MKPQRTIDLMRSGKPVRFVALGDSLTYGWMAERGYLDFLQEMLKERHPESAVRFINRGVPGDTAEGGLRRLKAEVIDCDPDLVLVQFGLNDAFSGCPVSSYGASIERIVERLRRETRAEVLLVTSVALADPAENALAEKYYGRLEQAARDLGAPVARVHAWWNEKRGGDFSGLLQSDLLHPTAEGYRLMAEAIMRELQ